MALTPEEIEALKLKRTPQAPVGQVDENESFDQFTRNLPEPSQQGFPVPSMGAVSQVPGIGKVTLGQAPIVTNEGIQYQTPERGRDDMNVKERISDAWNQSVLGQKMKGAFGQQVFGVGNDQYQIRNKFLGIVGGQVPYSEASPQAKSDAMKAHFLGGITERPVGQTYEQAREQATQPEAVAAPVPSIAPDQITQQAQAVPSAPGGVPQIGGTISSGGRTFTFAQGGGQIAEPSQAQMQDFAQRSQAAEQARGGSDIATINQSGEFVSPSARGLSPVEQQNVAEGRPPNVSAARAQDAMRAMAEQRTERKMRDMIAGAPTEVFRQQAVAKGFTGEAIEQYADTQSREWAAGQVAQSATGTGGLTPYQAVSASQRQQEIDMKIRAGMEEKQAKQEADQQASLANVRASKDAYDKLEPVAKEIATLSGSPFTQGGMGWVASKIPMATDARQIERLSKELEGTTFLQGLIEAKAKGATFGALSEREGDRILAARGKLIDPSSTNEQRISAVNDMMETIQKSMERATADYESKYGKQYQSDGQPVSTLKAGQVQTSSGKTYTVK